ncbi:MAG TPA: hypothetical protein V6C46_02820, partial [Coleofasciculaceae cyanobacterium]
VVGTNFALHVMPATGLVFNTPRLASRRPSNIIPIGAPPDKNDVFYLGLDLEFVGTNLGHPHMPDLVNVEVRFFLEAYGTTGGASGTPHRHEINIKPQVFTSLNANPTPPPLRPDREIRHQLWVQVARSDFDNIIEAPKTTWADLFQPDTIYRVAASVKIVDIQYIRCHPHAALTGFIEGLVMQTEAWDPYIGTQP